MMKIIPIPGFSEPVSSLSHLMAALAAFIGIYFLYKRGSGNRTRFFSLSVFSFSLIFLFSMSGVYHLLEPGGLPREVFRRLDHAAIWVLIAGTFTPIHALLFRGLWRWGFLLLIWSISIVGLVLEVIFLHDIPEWLSLSFYLSLGWMGLLSGYKYAKEYEREGSILLAKGGAAYSLGAILEFLRWPVIFPGIVGPHEVFHIMIIWGASYHWLFIYQRAGHPLISRLVVDVIERPGNVFFARVRGEKIEVHSSSISSLRDKLHQEISIRFPKYVRPDSVVLKFFKEDILKLK